MNILVINTGSSSLKYQLFDMRSEKILAKGNCERIGIDGYVKHEPSNGKPILKDEISMPSHSEALNIVIQTLTSEKYGVINSLKEIHAIGHRVVHGGKKFSSSVLIDDEVMKGIVDCAKLAPLHIPANLMGIYACQKTIPDVPHVAVFDTAFHLSIPNYAHVYPIPYKYYEKYDIRRYGFHGTSHRYVSSKAIEFLKDKPGGLRIVTCHLGNGASLAAISDGKSVDTTMGATPLEGLPMGTRSGTIDPALVYVISEIEGSLPLSETLEILNKKSGVLGISGVSSDFRDIMNMAEFDLDEDRAVGEVEDIKDVERARLALSAFKYQVAKFIGAYIVALGGVDAIVFTAGVGENSPPIRRGICEWLCGFGIYLDEDKNGHAENDKITDITKAGSSASVLVIPTNEELVIARDTMEIVKNIS
ncbi:MAG: acetate kinase [Oscillospiraceae bacterium]|nr:acetate kinase [Oscillospiraceae bacterium]